MKIIAPLIAAALLALSAACTAIPKKEAVVCNPANPETSEEAERDGLDRNYIACIIDRDAIPAVRRCYETTFSEAGYTSEPTRAVSLFQIGIDGHVIKSETTADRGSKTLPVCVNDTIKTLNFAKPYGGVPVKVSYPFTFKRSGQSGGRDSIFDNF